MGSLHLHIGNRLETLMDLLAECLREPLDSPMEPECVMVQSKGMEHWICLELARRHGICANIRFPFPNRLLEEIHERVTEAPVLSSDFSSHRLRWHLFGHLRKLMGGPLFAHVRAYLSEDASGLRRFQLADRIADTFDQYLVFRPDMIFRWEAGEENHWQAELWRTLINGLPDGMHRAARGHALLKALQSPSAAGALPARISVFGISALPRFHMDVLAALASHVRVDLFLMNPCKEYWGDIVSDRVIARTSAGEQGNVDAADLHLDRGHPLLASTGMMGRDFFEMVHDYSAEETEQFHDPGEDSLLHALQSDILHLRERGRNGARSRLSRKDDSIRVHSCHSPLREVEVLHDRLLELLQGEPGLTPADVLVTTPDIETYAPFVRAVFDAAGKGEARIPYSIADRSIRREGTVIDAFMSLLDLHRERYALSKVLALLESPAVARRFDMTEAERETVRQWVAESGVRWGLDDRDRARRNLPPLQENTWAAGLRRLLLGYAMAGAEEQPFEGILPYDPVEGSDAVVLDKLLTFAHALFEVLPSLEHQRTPEDWSRVLLDLMDRFFTPDEESEREFLALHEALNELLEAADSEGPAVNEPLSLDLIRWFLSRRFEREGLGFGFMTGGVTFCAMLPMRSIPFRVICCLGMNCDAFPKTLRAPEFDLMSRDPRRGDRSRRNDDRYLFLETLLSARDRLHISYVGQSPQDNTALPPSVLVSELLDTIEQGFEASEGVIRDRIVVLHRLQAFSPAYFDDRDPLRTFSSENLAAAEALLETPREPPPFIPSPLDPPGPEWKQVSLEGLVRFFRNPSAFLLRERLGVTLQKAGDALEDREPFSLAGLDRYDLGRQAVERCLRHGDPQAGFEGARAAGRLPHGAIGRNLYENLTRTAEHLARGIAPHLKAEALEPLNIQLEIGDVRITGVLDALRESGRVQYRFAPIRPKDRLSAWIRHLVLNAAGALPPEAARTVLIGLGSGRSPLPPCAEEVYGPVAGAETLLLDLLERYLRGLCEPLAFFPEASWEYARALHEGKSKADALNRAEKAWEGSDYHRGESEDPHAAVCFRGRDPLETRDFHEQALGIFDPLIENGKERDR